jgi:predicted HicB family RNase H-like nuclease
VARINEAATDTRVRLQYEAREFILAVEANTAAENAPDPMTRMDGDLEKVTIRLPKPLKERIDEAASDRGESLNTWYVRTLARGVMRHMRDRRPEDAGAFGHRGRLGRRRGRYGFAGEEEAIGRSSGE